MRTISTAALAVLVIAALFWGNCFSCPQPAVRPIRPWLLQANQSLLRHPVAEKLREIGHRDRRRPRDRSVRHDPPSGVPTARNASTNPGGHHLHRSTNNTPARLALPVFRKHKAKSDPRPGPCRSPGRRLGSRSAPGRWPRPLDPGPWPPAASPRPPAPGPRPPPAKRASPRKRRI